MNADEPGAAVPLTDPSRFEGFVVFAVREQEAIDLVLYCLSQQKVFE